MADYKLYAFGESGNCYKVAMMLALTGTPWERLPVDYFNGETRGEEFRAINEMGEAPVLLHGDKVLSQSGVILDYLAEQTGRFGAENEDERREILRWTLFDNHKFTSYYATLRFLVGLQKSGENPVTEFLRGRARAAFAIVDEHLGNSDFLIGNRLTIADLSLAGYIFFDEATGMDLADYPNILAWRARIAAMPGWKSPYELVPHAPKARG
ncbi:glutathione S-transferase [Labrys miyagiensis]